MDFVDALSEIWFVVSYAAYHLAYVRIYLQTIALQTDVNLMREQEQELRELAQVDTVVCRAHLAAFFWQLDPFLKHCAQPLHAVKRNIPVCNIFGPTKGACRNGKQNHSKRN